MKLYLRPFCISLYFSSVVVATVFESGCYSFTGASVPPHWKSIAIPLFDDESTYGQPVLRETITNLLIEKFQRDNTLQISDLTTATLEMKGTITSIEADQPIAVAQGTQSTRLQVVIKTTVTLFDRTTKKQTWKKTFSAAGDYSPAGGPAEREIGIRQALDKITDDILLETISAW